MSKKTGIGPIRKFLTTFVMFFLDVSTKTQREKFVKYILQFPIIYFSFLVTFLIISIILTNVSTDDEESKLKARDSMLYISLIMVFAALIGLSVLLKTGKDTALINFFGIGI